MLPKKKKSSLKSIFANQPDPNFPAPAMPASHIAELKRDDRQTGLDEMRFSIRSARKSLAFKMVDMLHTFDEMSEKEFREVIGTLTEDGNGLIMSELIEKFKKYKGA